ncbi:hypothetical protein BDZ94DRAFT_1334303 [Collybia nuda]|uniref:Uncharacterized protein n=1 Tax=Collybia nuda TaxID=64659 RepID=A0A9P5YD38_9AGAR|nr:hypothetical protein BDZ94DRAFT_1334303 [Collybia nuda]
MYYFNTTYSMTAFSGSTDSGQCQVIQEHAESGLLENFIIHTGTTEHYLINTHGQHNPQLIHKALP